MEIYQGNMVILFIVTSAINNDSIRLQETRETIESIHRRVPSASIWLLESSLDNQHFRHPRVFVKHFGGHAFVKEAHDKGKEIGYLKSAIEMYTTQTILPSIPTLFSHVFKLSGRYTLTDDFNLLEHPANKATFVERQTGFKEDYVGTTSMLMTRLYSFCHNIIPQMTEALGKMREFHEAQWGSGKVFDIEHGYYKFLPSDILHKVGKIGVRGRIGHISSIVED
jgi:hypothetical protein